MACTATSCWVPRRRTCARRTGSSPGRTLPASAGTAACAVTPGSPSPPPGTPEVDHPPERDQVVLPLRGRPLRDRYVLRLIAVERALHVLVLAAVAVAIFAFATHRRLLHQDYTRILSALQGAFGGPVARSGWASDINRLFRLSTAKLYGAGAAVTAYTAVLVLEIVGLWHARRWAEYLTLIEAGALVPFEILTS